jgi:hypothetical protein
MRLFNPNSLILGYGLVKIHEEHVLNSRKYYRGPNPCAPSVGVFEGSRGVSNGSNTHPLKATLPVYRVQ